MICVMYLITLNYPNHKNVFFSLFFFLFERITFVSPRFINGEINRRFVYQMNILRLNIATVQLIKWVISNLNFYQKVRRQFGHTEQTGRRYKWIEARATSPSTWTATSAATTVAEKSRYAGSAFARNGNSETPSAVGYDQHPGLNQRSTPQDEHEDPRHEDIFRTTTQKCVDDERWGSILFSFLIFTATRIYS